MCGCIFVHGICSGESRKIIFGGVGEIMLDWIFDTILSILLVDFVDVNVGFSGWRGGLTSGVAINTFGSADAIMWNGAADG